MVVADSRANAVRYYFAVKKYLEDHTDISKGSDVMIAFSNTVKIDGQEYVESSMNIDENGKYITSDKKFRKAFRSSKYNILVVADKYQTGFDEPFLHSMYVDKKLSGVNAVQTLSRLNRTAYGKDDTFVLDFENTDEEIKESFQPFYESTSLEGSTDINKVYDLRNNIKEYMLYNWDEVTEFKKFMLKQSDKKQTTQALGQLSSMLKPVVDRYNELDEDDRFNAREYIKKFNNAYSFVTQLVRLNDEDLFDEFLYTSHLIKVLPAQGRTFIDIDDKIQLEYASLKETFNGSIILDKKSVDLTPQGTGKPKGIEKKKDTLQSIIDKVNERFSGDFTESDRVIIEGIYQMFMKDDEIKKFKRLAKGNSAEMFVNSLFPDKFKDIVTQCFIENNDSFQKLFNDPEFYQKVMDAMAKELYKSLRND